MFLDTKNSVGLVGCIEEVAHNAIAVYWNPLESSAKVRKKTIYIKTSGTYFSLVFYAVYMTVIVMIMQTL